MGTYVLHEHTFPCQVGKYPFEGRIQAEFAPFVKFDQPGEDFHGQEVLPLLRRCRDEVERIIGLFYALSPSKGYFPSSRRYSPSMKQIWSGRVAQAAAKYGENAPTAAVCCNACRTCVTTNLIGFATAVLAAAGYRIARFARRT